MTRWRTLVLGALAALVLLAGAVAAFIAVRDRQSRDVRGSSTVEFTPTE